MRGLPASGTAKEHDIEQIHEPTRALGETSGMHIHLHVPWGMHLRKSSMLLIQPCLHRDGMRVIKPGELR